LRTKRSCLQQRAQNRLLVVIVPSNLAKQQRESGDDNVLGFSFYQRIVESDGGIPERN